MRDVRGHHEGTQIQRPNGVKYVVVSLPGGQRRSRRACPHVHPPADRRKWCPEARQTLRDLQALEPEQLAANRLTLGSYLSGWLEDVRPRLAPATWRKHEQHCRNWLIPRLGSHRLSDLSVVHVRAFLASTAGEIDPQTRRHHRASLRRALADAQREGLVTRNVAALAEPPPLPHRERPILTAAQVRVLIDGTAAHRPPPGAEGPDIPADRLHALWVLLATTGLREAEALGLTWEDVDLGGLHGGHESGKETGAGAARPCNAAARDAEHLAATGARRRADGRGHRDERGGRDHDVHAARGGAVHVRHTLHRIDGEWQLRAPKTPKSRRTVTLPAVTADALREHRRRQLEERMAAGVPTEDGLVFVRPDGRPYHGSKLTALLYPILDRLGLPRVHVHDLRHGFATIMLAEGVELITVSRMLGHSSIRITADVYAKVMPRLEEDAMDRMQRAVG